MARSVEVDDELLAQWHAYRSRPCQPTRDSFITSCRPYVGKVISAQFRPSRQDLEDLEQEGMLAVLRALYGSRHQELSHFLCYAKGAIVNAVNTTLKKESAYQKNVVLLETELETNTQVIIL